MSRHFGILPSRPHLVRYHPKSLIERTKTIDYQLWHGQAMWGHSEFATIEAAAEFTAAICDFLAGGAVSAG
jgi:hypothetical protein